MYVYTISHFTIYLEICVYVYLILIQTFTDKKSCNAKTTLI